MVADVFGIKIKQSAARVKKDDFNSAQSLTQIYFFLLQSWKWFKTNDFCFVLALFFETVLTIFTGVKLPGFFRWISALLFTMRATLHGIFDGVINYLCKDWIHQSLFYSTRLIL